MESPRVSSATTQATNSHSLKTKWLLCPKCTKNIPTIISIINNEQASIVLDCQCGCNQIMNIEDYLSSPIPSLSHECDACHDKIKRNDVLYCFSCLKWLCPECITKHNIMDSTKDHTFIKSEIIMKAKCLMHSEKFNVSFCYTCERGVCDDCLKEDHKSHDTIKLKELHNNLGMAFDLDRINEGITSIMKQKENTKNIYIKMVDNYIDNLRKYKTEVEAEYLNNKNKNELFSELINILFSNYEFSQLYPNYNIIRNLEINACLNIKDFEPSDYTNFAIYTRELVQYFKNNYIINFNISTTYEKIRKIPEYWVNNLLQISSTAFASSSINDIKLWSLHNYKCLATLTGHSKPITALIKLNKSNQIASSSFDKTIKIWKTSEPYNCVCTLTGHKSEVNAIMQPSFSNNLFSISEDGTLITWDLLKQKPSKLLYIEKSVHLLKEISAKYISVDSRAIIKLYDFNNFSKARYLIGHSDEVSSMCLLSNGKLASGSKDKTIRIWNINSQVCEITLKGNESKVVSIIQLSDQSLLSACSDGAINMWDAEFGHKLCVLNKTKINAITFIKISDEIFFSSSKESIDIWKIKKNRKNNIIDNEFRLFC